MTLAWPLVRVFGFVGSTPTGRATETNPHAQCMTAKGNRIPAPPPYYWGGYCTAAGSGAACSELPRSLENR